MLLARPDEAVLILVDAHRTRRSLGLAARAGLLAVEQHPHKVLVALSSFGPCAAARRGVPEYV